MNTPKHNKWANQTIPWLDDQVGPKKGLFVLPANVPEVGEQVVIIVRDEAPKIEKLCRVEPFHLTIKPGVSRNAYGPVAWGTFSISQPDQVDRPVASFVECFDPHQPDSLSLWRGLAGQDQWHLFLVVKKEIRQYIKFDNRFDLDTGLNAIVERAAQCPTVDHAAALALFQQQFSVPDLLQMPTGHSVHRLVLSKQGV